VTIPTSPLQLAFYLALLVPGVIFAFARIRLRGPRAADRSVAARVLEAIVASAILDAIYALIFSTQLEVAASGPYAYVVSHIPECAAIFLGLGVGVPYVAAWIIYGRVPWLSWGVTYWERIRPRLTLSREDADTPTAWDWGAKTAVSGWVRVRLSEGVWVGGVWDERGRYATYPEARDIFIAEQWQLDENGKFKGRVELTQGMWVSVRDDYVVEWLLDKEDPDVEHSQE
jgi:hypothetical protein